MDKELKKMLDDLNAAFVAFKASNDERIKQLETRGSVDAVTAETVRKSNEAITALTKTVNDHATLLKEIETINARINMGAADKLDEQMVHARSFLSFTRNTIVENVSADDLAQYRAYRRAFGAYLRKGDAIRDSDVRAALQTGQAPAGGYWVTPDITGRMVEFLRLTSPIRQVASTQVIGTDTLEGSIDLDQATSGGWVGETASRSETNTPSVPFPWILPLYEQYANPRTTQKMLDDVNFDVEAWLARKTADIIARTENTSFVTGNNASKPRGFTTYTAGTPGATAATWPKIQQINSGASGAFSSTNPLDKFLDVIHAIKQGKRQGAQWAMNNLTLAEVRKMKDGEGRYLLNSDVSQAGVTNRLLGYPILEFEDMADMASASLSIAFANWAAAYQIVDHVVGMRTIRDNLTAKPYIQFYTTKRTGGGVIDFESIKLMKFSA